MAQHLTCEERRVIARLQQAGKSKAEIAETIGRARSTIYRELARNSVSVEYRPHQAHELAKTRRRNSRRPCKLADPQLEQYVRERLKKCWSPDQIAGRAKREFPRQVDRWVSRQTIYNWLQRQRPEWRKWLRRGGKLPETRGKLPACVRIGGRPEAINRRRRFGDWEGDTIVGKGRRSGLLTLVERKSGLTRVGKLDDLSSATTTRVACQRLGKLPKKMRRSTTFDNGKEFADHATLAARMELKIYFADPYKSWQRGTNENTNGLLRQYFPKGTDFAAISRRAVARVEKELNERPRRRLGYKTPIEALGPRICRD